jgi:3-oxoacyl-[acyl-carrier-protein] synthase II
VITGLGVVSPVGADVETFWAALLAGTSGAAPVESFDTSGFPSRIGCEVRGLALESASEPRPGRAALLASAAGRQALAQAGLAGPDAGLAIGTTMGESCWLEAWDPEDVRSGNVPAEELVRSGPDQVGRDVASELGLGGRVVVLAGACAAGNYALGHALDLIRLGRADAVLAGGTDAFSRVAFTGFARLGALAAETCRPFSADRDGLVLGEGAAMLVVESATAAAARGAEPLAELAGSASPAMRSTSSAPIRSAAGRHGPWRRRSTTPVPTAARSATSRPTAPAHPRTTVRKSPPPEPSSDRAARR